VVAALLLGLATLVPAAASAATPSATTGDATNVTSTSAVVHGTASPGSTPSWNYYFQYGRTAGYGQTTLPAPLSSPQNVSATLHDLDPGITYHYRLVVFSNYEPGGSTVTGHDRTFTTPLSPGSVATTGQATGLHAHSATLNGVVNTSTPSAVWYFQYGRSAAYGHSTTRHTTGASGLTLVQATVKGLSPRTTYHFRLVVEVPGSPPAYGQDASFTTPKPSAHARLRSHRLAVSHGVASIPWGCSGPRGSKCKARVSLKTHLSSGAVSCASGKLNMSARHRKTMHLRLRSACEGALRRSHSHHFAATLQAIFTTDQKPIKTGVSLNGT
jgi:hypothetical protein